MIFAESGILKNLKVFENILGSKKSQVIFPQSNQNKRRDSVTQNGSPHVQTNGTSNKKRFELK